MKEYKFIALILAIVIISLGCVRFCNNLVEKTIDQTIKNAVLIESNESGYTLNFYGQEYNYSFD